MATQLADNRSSEEKLSSIRDKILAKEKSKTAKENRNKEKKRKSSSSASYAQPNGGGAYTRNMHVHILETEAETDIVMGCIKYSGAVGLDFEGIITMGRTGKISLVQICARDNIYLFDILKMNYKIPDSLHQWLSSNRCTKYIHDSRQDQDALYHCHNIELGGIFDTTIANLIQRCWIAKSNRIDRLRGMDALANCVIQRARDHKILLSIQPNQCGEEITIAELCKKGKRKQYGDIVEHTPYPNQSEKVEQIKVNTFDIKQNTKLMMKTDAYLWAKRPIPINLVTYAAIDAYVSLLMGQYFVRKFNQWQIDKTLLVSAKWCRMVARTTIIRKGSAKVALPIVKLIRSNTDKMELSDIPPIYQGDNIDQIKEEKELDTMDLNLDDLLLLSERRQFIAHKLEDKMNPNQKCHAKGIMEYVTDVYKLEYGERHNTYVQVGKLNYNRLIPLKVINDTKGNL